MDERFSRRRARLNDTLRLPTWHSSTGPTLRERWGLNKYATMDTRLEPRVRRAIPADANGLAELRFAFRTSLAEPVESQPEFLTRCAAWMRSRLDGETHWRAWILETDVGPAGTVWVQIVEKLPNPVVERELHAYVTNFFVHPDQRGRGAGGRLLSAAIAECDALRVDTVFLWPTPQSRALYERHGFATKDSVMFRVL
jgi:GNAT superfamily N-acetyltransferase